MSEELKPFTEWFDREVETGVRYSDNVTASLGPWSERREKFIRVIMQEAFFAAWNQRAKSPEMEEMAEALSTIIGMTDEIARAPMTAERWAERIEEVAVAALAKARGEHLKPEGE